MHKCNINVKKYSLVLKHTVHYQALAVSLEVAYNTKFIIINTFCSTQSHTCQNLNVWSNLSLSMLWITMSNKLNRSNRMHFIQIKLNMHIHRNDLDFLPGLTKRSHIPFISHHVPSVQEQRVQCVRTLTLAVNANLSAILLFAEKLCVLAGERGQSEPSKSGFSL